MEKAAWKSYLGEVLDNMPSDWLNLTTHRLDIYDESRAKTQFTEQFDQLYQEGNAHASVLSQLPTAFDYIRLGHPLSCVLEWAMAQQYGLEPTDVISFSSRTMPVLAVLRKNLMTGRHTRLVYLGHSQVDSDIELIRQVYGYSFEVLEAKQIDDIPSFNGTTLCLTSTENLFDLSPNPSVDFYVQTHPKLGSVILANGQESRAYISEIQHVRRRESIAMTPANCLEALNGFIGRPTGSGVTALASKKNQVLETIKRITGSNTKAVVGSSGLSIQYAITMGLIHDAMENHPGHPIRMIVPPNCYGGTNDQARRVAACLDQVEVVDLPVDGDHRMEESIDVVLDQMARENAVPLIIVEIPTNPRVEVPNLDRLKEALSKTRYTDSGEESIDPIFIVDQTFCPNVQFLGESDMLASIRAISYVSGSKFPSGGRCTAGYALANQKAAYLMDKIERHLSLCDNEVTDLQMEILSEQMPSMNQRIQGAYENTREFVHFIQENLPEAKINFVSEELASKGFTPSVFSLDLPTKGESHEEREEYKRRLNHLLIQMMIDEIPQESKYCVSYGQLKGCYWTIPATSTQGTTKEEDKDYIARVSCSPNMDLEKHKKIFLDFVEKINQGVVITSA